MKRDDFIKIGKNNRAKIIAAAVSLWEKGGEKAVTARAVGAECGITGQRVQQIFKTMEHLRDLAAANAIATGNDAVITRLRSEGHRLVSRPLV